MSNTHFGAKRTPVSVEGEHPFRNDGEHFLDDSEIGVRHAEIESLNLPGEITIA